MSNSKVRNTYDNTQLNSTGNINDMILADKLEISNIKEQIIVGDISLENPTITLLEQNKDLLFRDAVEIDFKDSWIYKPAYASLEYFGTTAYAYIIMYMNDITRRRDFKKAAITQRLKFPSKTSINILQQLAKMNKKINVNTTKHINPLYKIDLNRNN